MSARPHWRDVLTPDERVALDRNETASETVLAEWERLKHERKQIINRAITRARRAGRAAAPPEPDALALTPWEKRRIRYGPAGMSPQGHANVMKNLESLRGGNKASRARGGRAGASSTHSNRQPPTLATLHFADPEDDQ